MPFAQPQTPQRPLPGAYVATPALQQRQSIQAQSQASIFKVPLAPTSQAQTQNVLQSGQTQSSGVYAGVTSAVQSLSPVERAARTINTTLDQEAKYPAMDNYIYQGYSSDYEIPESSAWAPFQKIKMFDIPDRIFEQYNRAQVSTMMGLFADLNYAWITIDNALYMWDYTNPNPELIGFEEQSNSITAVKLVYPKAGVFVDSISRLLVVATTSDIFLIGVGIERASGGPNVVTLYRTRMQISVRGLNVTCIEGSSKTGRIFFGTGSTEDIYEIVYQQEEKWFQNRCKKVNHTTNGLGSVLGMVPIPFAQVATQEYLVQLVIDDTRSLLYTLSSRSKLQVLHLQPPESLNLRLSREFKAIISDTEHKVGKSTLLGPNTKIVSLSSIQDKEAQRLNLIATTSTGCRIYFSFVSGSYFGNNNVLPTSMQVHHIRFPPADPHQPVQSATQASSVPMLPYGNTIPNVQSESLSQSRMSTRFPPGYFLCLVQKRPSDDIDTLFISAPDTGRISRPLDPSSAARYPEFGLWINLESQAQDVGLVTPPFAASSTPLGFGNELAVQFDKPTSEIAVLTNTGVYTFRRRRLVDIFAAAARNPSSEEGVVGEINKFVRLYGRGETVASALAVACGQGSEVSIDSRVGKVTDPEVLEYARKAFIDYGGGATLNENHVIDEGSPNLENVKPSPRHQGMSLYISRLLRALWKSRLLFERKSPTGGLTVEPAVPLTKLQEVQQNLTRLQEFLDQNKSFIEGLAGPDALGRVSTKQEEIALQGEHRALHSLVQLIFHVIEGISFVLVLFDERVEEILLSVTAQVQQQVREMTFEGLFCTSNGKELAKELVKSIVNRNIANGSNVDTVTDALRRRCGSFCSADDCVIFKAQEQLKKASEAGPSSESSRNLLNESLRLLQRVATSLSMEQLRWAVEQYISMDFYAGAIQLCLSVAQESDRGNRALAWINEGSPETDGRFTAFESRSRCYDLIHQTINAVDRATANNPETIDGQYTLMAKRKLEAYDIINDSQDEVFQINLYDWYLSQGWSDRLLEVKSPFVIKYLRRKSLDDLGGANLLWKYYAQYSNFLEAASVQLTLAKSAFDLSLEHRIEFLSRAKANASTKIVGMSDLSRSRQSRQELIREVSDLLDVANIQEDLLQRMRSDPRLSEERRPQVIRALNGRILPLDDLYNGFADQASYHDLCLLIYHVADYRNPTDIRATWQNLLEATHQQAALAGEPLPYEAVIEKVRSLGARLNLSETTFPIPILIPMLENYAFEYQRNIGPPTWVVDVFLDLHVPHEALVSQLEAMYYNLSDDVNTGNGHSLSRRQIADDMLHVIQRWYHGGVQLGAMAFGGEDTALNISQLLRAMQTNATDDRFAERCAVLRARIEQLLR